MKQILLLIALIWFTVTGAIAQNVKVTGSVTESEAGNPLPNVTVNINSFQVLTNEKGFFEFNNLKPGKGIIYFSAEGYESFSLPVDIGKTNIDLGKIKLKFSKPIEAAENGLTEVSLSSDDMEAEDQDISGLLNASSDIFVSTASYTLGSAYFRIRGYDGENQSVYMSGIPVNDPENGRASWSEWGGLNDAMRNKVVTNGTEPSDFSFGNVGGASDIITRASMQRKQTKLSYSLSNRTYTNRLMLTYSTGMQKNGWAFTVSGSRRWGQEGYVDGTFYDAWAYFLGIEKKLSNKHSLAFTVYGAPTRRGQQGAAVQEADDAVGSNYYNPNWGYQDGEKRNAKIKHFHEPMFILNDYYKLNDKTKITTSVGYTFGTTGTTALNWYNAADPRPDYYRYLPDYNVNPASPKAEWITAKIAQAWKNDPNTSQINWDKLYQINLLGNLTGKQANYIVEDRRMDHKQFDFNSHINHDVNEHIALSGGLEYQNYTANYYKTIDDLLGGKYWVDIDQFSQRDFETDTIKYQNDLRHPNRVVKQGDRFGYDYDLHKNSGQLWMNSQYKFSKFDFYFGASVSHTTIWRDGKMLNGRDTVTSYGESKKLDFTNFGIKGGLTYKLNGRNFIEGNISYITRAPFIRNVYISPRISAKSIAGLESEEVFSTDLSYIYRGPIVKARVTVYNTNFTNGSEVTSFYMDQLVNPTFVNYAMKNINKTHQGLEIGLEGKATSRLTLFGVAGIGNFRYTNRPTVTISYENGSQADVTDKVYQKNFYVPGTPQTALSGGFKYAAPHYWFFDANVNYFDNIYLDFNPDRRTERAIANLGEGDPLIKEITEQQKLKSGITMDASIGKSWKIKQYFLNFNLSVSNILDNKDLITGGYEQSRFEYEKKEVDKFPPKYYYYYGRTFFMNVGFRF